MSGNYTRNYVQELEQLVLNELLPVYERWHREHNLPINNSKLPTALIQSVKQKKSVAALLKPPQI